ncbi:MAG TPA: hypothetical protein V6C58_09350 [Allocoleopsis sp.]
MINDNFLNGLATLVTGGSYSIPSYLAFGSTTGTLTANDIITSGEFDRNILTSDSNSANTATFVGARTGAEANNEYVNIIGLVNTSTLFGSNDIQANFLLPSVLHSTSFDLNIEVNFTFNRS